MDSYTLETAPGAVLFDVMNDPRYHEACGQWVVLVDPRHPPGDHPKPTLKLAKVKPPVNPNTHFQGMKWWPENQNFTYADLEEPIQ